MDKDELINGYFEGVLTKAQLERLALLRETDTEFAKDFEFEIALQKSLKKGERQELKEMFSEISSVKETPETKVFQMRTWLAAASVALVVGLASWIFFFNNSAIDTEQLYAANFAPYDNVVSPIERGNEIEDLRTMAFMAYENEEYIKALELFAQLKKEQNEPYIDFYEANLRMQLGQHIKAIPLLKNYIANKGQLADRAIWYLALSHLKLGEIEACKEQLVKLIELGTFKTKAAEELLAQLN